MTTLKFDGVDDRVDLSSNTGTATDLTAYTIICWVWPDSTGFTSDNRITNKATGTAIGSMQMNQFSSVTGLRVRQHVGTVSTGQARREYSSGFLTTNTWQCIAMTWEGDTGASRAPYAWNYPGSGTAFTSPTPTGTAQSTLATNLDTDQVLQYGNTTDSSRPWKGNLGPVGLYSRVLTGAEMYQFMLGNPPTDGLVRLWEMDSGTIRDLVSGMEPTVYGATYDTTRDEGLVYSLGGAEEYTVSGTLSGSGSLTSSTSIASTVPLNLQGSGSLSQTTELSITQSVQLSGVGTLSSTTNTEQTQESTVSGTLNGSGSLSATSQLAVNSNVNLNGLGTLSSTTSFTEQQDGSVVGLFTGSGSLTSDTELSLSIDALFESIGNLNTTIEPAFEAAGVLSGVGTLTGSAYVPNEGGGGPAPSFVLIHNRLRLIF